MNKKRTVFTPSGDISANNLIVLYNEIANNVHVKNADFVLPQNLKFAELGNKLAFCQLINTWFKKNNSSKVRIYDSNFPKEEIEVTNIIKKIVADADIHVLIALIYGTKTGIWGYTNKTKNYTSLFRKPLIDRIIFDYKKLGNLSQDNFLPSEYYQIHPDLFFGSDFFKNNSTFYISYSLNNQTRYILKKQEGIDEVSKKLFSRVRDLEGKISLEKPKPWFVSPRTTIMMLLSFSPFTYISA